MTCTRTARHIVSGAILHFVMLNSPPALSIRWMAGIPPLTTSIVSLPITKTQKDNQMTTFHVHSGETAPEGSKSILAATQKKFDFVPRVRTH